MHEKWLQEDYLHSLVIRDKEDAYWPIFLNNKLKTLCDKIALHCDFQFCQILQKNGAHLAYLSTQWLICGLCNLDTQPLFQLHTSITFATNCIKWAWAQGERNCSLERRVVEGDCVSLPKCFQQRLAELNLELLSRGFAAGELWEVLQPSRPHLLNVTGVQERWRGYSLARLWIVGYTHALGSQSAIPPQHFRKADQTFWKACYTRNNIKWNASILIQKGKNREDVGTCTVTIYELHWKANATEILCTTP